MKPPNIIRFTSNYILSQLSSKQQNIVFIQQVQRINLNTMLNSQQSRSQRRLYEQMLMKDGRSDSMSSSSLKNLKFPIHIEIELENGKKEYIIPQVNDKPLQLATKFCLQHNLQFDMIDILTESIEESMRKAKLETISSEKRKESGMKLQKRHIKSQQAEKCYYSICEYRESDCRESKNESNLLYLYEKALRDDSAKKSWIQKQKSQLLKKQLKQCTYRPQINKRSREIVNRARVYSTMLEDQEMQTLQVRSSLMKQKSLKSKKQLASSKMIKSTCHRSNLEDDRSDLSAPNRDVFSQLYENHKINKLKNSIAQQTALKQHNHTPKINDISKEIVGRSKFYERLQKYAFERILREKNQRKDLQKQNKSMFHPTTGPGPSGRNLQNLSIGEFLYRKRKNSPKAQKILQNPIINNISKKMYENKKTEVFTKIFRILDKNCNGKISKTQIHTVDLPMEIQKIISPLIQELELLDWNLVESQFVQSMNSLFITLNPSDKNALLTSFEAKKGKENYENSFKPQINKNSKKMVNETQRAKMKIHQYCSIKESAKSQLLQNQRVQKERKQMKQCTFHPKIQRQRYIY